MHKNLFAGCLLCLVLLAGLACGCQVFQSEPTLAVLVRDAETKKPVATAEVYVCQRLKNHEVAPCRSKGGFTQADGIVQVRAEQPEELGLEVQAVAQGYLPEKVDVSADVVNARRQTAARESQTAKAARKPTEPRSPDVVVEMYAEPAFSVELVLPPNYRGLVKVGVELSDNFPLAMGQRCFRFPVSPTGEAQVRGPSLLQSIAVPDFRARYANGPYLGTKLEADKIGFRWLKGAGNQHCFVVGTQLDYEKFHAQLTPEETRAAGHGGDDGRKHKYRYGKITAKNYEKD